MNQSVRAHWSGRLAFILAAAGSAIGLGNIWKFPYITGENGGGAFVLIYLACIAVVGLPILIAEMYIGQKAQRNTVEAFEVIHKKGTFWRVPGWLGLASAFLILSFYSVVGGWILDFEFRSILGEFYGKDESTIKTTLTGLFSAWPRQLLWHTVFMVLTVGIVLGGVKNGLERWNKILMPVLLGILGLLFVYSMTLPGFKDSIGFLFSFDTSKLSPAGVLEAVGHSFFTLSLGMGTLITYGSYLGKDENLPKIAVAVAFMDTMIALVAGIVIFSVVYSFNMEPGAGPGLILVTLPVLFNKMGMMGYIVSVLFFMLVSFAAITSAVSILETVVAYWDETRNVERKKGTILVGIVIYLVGLLSVFSTNLLSDFKVASFAFEGGLTFFDLFDKLTSSYFLPIGGLLISLYFGWVVGLKGIQEATRSDNDLVNKGLLWTARVIAPGAVLDVLMNLAFGTSVLKYLFGLL